MGPFIRMQLKKSKCTGLMCIPPNNSDPNIYFEKMLNLKTQVNKI